MSVCPTHINCSTLYATPVGPHGIPERLRRKLYVYFENIQKLCPAIATMLSNTYRSPVRLFIKGEGELASTEGTTQGDPLAMGMYALAVTPLICKLRETKPEVKQVWFADDATAAGKLISLREWWQHLAAHGPEIGYLPNTSKTHLQLVVKPELLDKAKKIFENTEVQISSQGQRHLGAAIGTSAFANEYVALKVEKWSTQITSLSTLARTHPQAAYSAFVHGFAVKWQYVMRSIDFPSSLFQPLEDAIHQELIPALTGREPNSPEERKLLALPVRHGGLNICNPVEMTETELMGSKSISAPLTEMITSQTNIRDFTKP